MRVIAGTKKGVRLSSVNGHWIRPTSDRIKELIFDVLNDLVKDSLVLDIFAGTGSLGIEALSRGAAKAIFVENNHLAQRIIQNNLNKTRFVDSGEILKVSAQNSYKRLADLDLKFDIILADPPYEKNLASKIVKAVENYKLLKEGGWFVVEHSHKDILLNLTSNFTLKTRKRQGDSVVSFYQNVKNE